jgi:long-chain acyl-CoA synthetase
MMTSNPISRAISRLGQVVPIDPERGVISSLAFGAAVLKRGNNLVWFPEGALARGGGLQEFRPGIGVLLERYQTLAVPVAISGTDRALPPDTWRLRPRRVSVEFGRPVSPRELALEGDGGRPAERIVSALRARVAAMQGAPADR